MKLLLLIVAVILIPLGYPICDWVYLSDIEHFALKNPAAALCDNPFHVKWWCLRMDLQMCIVGLAFWAHQFKSSPIIEKWENFIIYIGLGLLSSDIIDRMVFNVRIFTMTDILMVSIVVFIGHYKYILKQTKTHAR